MMQRINILSSAGQSDASEIARIEAECFNDPWSMDSLLAAVSDKNRYVAVKSCCDNVVAGYILCSTVLDEAELLRIAVSPSYRRDGIARSLIKEAKRLLCEKNNNGSFCIYLEVRQSNTAALRLYESCGFLQCGLRRNYYSHPDEDAVLMMLSI